MALTADFGPRDIYAQVEKTGLKGRHLTFIDDLSPDELSNLFATAEMLEPYWRSGLELLRHRILCTLFFQPSTRTRFSHETAMYRLGGNVLTESNPLVSSSAAKNESLYDSIRVIAQYADVLVLRHPDDQRVLADLEALGSDGLPIISGGYGDVTHPTQGLLDMYTAWRVLGGDFSAMTVMIATPDLSRARSGQSFALGLARMGARIVYSGTTGLRTPDVIREKLDGMGARYEEHNDLSIGQQEELIADQGIDLLYLPGCSVKKGDPGRDDFMKKMEGYYFTVEGLDRIRQKGGKTVGVMHSLPRNEGEFDFGIDNTAHELYFKQIGFSVPLRMSLIANIVGVS
jgi:aspartate carbamoyltransferase catalytic subunit|tara:strand:+ start:1177 stop:2208 length:1032 start_codon:yes stop_codon:yes gene_type:complete